MSVLQIKILLSLALLLLAAPVWAGELSSTSGALRVQVGAKPQPGVDSSRCFLKGESVPCVGQAYDRRVGSVAMEAPIDGKLRVIQVPSAEVCTDRTEFIRVMQTCQIDKKQTALYKQKDKAQDAIIKELKMQNTELRKDREVLLAYKDSAVELIEALRVDREERKQIEADLREQVANRPTNWLDRIEWAGYGAAVPTAVLVVRKLILKF